MEVDKEYMGVSPAVSKLYSDYWHNKLSGREFQIAITELINKEVVKARIDELEQAWDWAVQNNRSHIKGDWVLKRVRKLKALADTESMGGE